MRTRVFVKLLLAASTPQSLVCQPSVVPDVVAVPLCGYARTVVSPSVFCSQPYAALLSGVPLVVPAVVSVLVPVWYSYLPVVYPFWYPFCQPRAAVVILLCVWSVQNKLR